MLTKLSDRLKPTPAYAHTNPAYRQHAFRFRSVNPTTAAINAAFDASDPALNTNWTTPSFTTNLPFRLRIEVEETAGGGGSISPTLWVRRNTSAYAQVSGTSSWVQSVAASFADGAATTNLISSSARAFLTGWGDDVDATGADVTYTGNQHTELDFCLQIVENSVVNGDTLEFQVRDGSTVLGTYGVTPLINVVKPVPTLHQQAFRIRDDSIALNTDGGWLAAQDTNASFEAEKTFRIRFRVKVTGESKNTVQVSLRYSRNGGAYTAAFGQGTPSSPGITPATVEASVSDRYADQDAITSDLLTGATGTRVNGAGDEINGIHTTSSWEPDEYREFEFAIRIRKFYWDGSAVAENVDGTTFDFRLYDGSTPFDNYDVTPRVTVDSAGLVGGCWPEAPHHMGPIVDTNGNMYLFMESWELKTNGGWVVALKSTDGGLTWTAQDIADGPGATAGTDDWEGATVLQDNQVQGRVFLFSHHTSTVEKHIFFTSDHATTPDQWGTVGTVVSTFTAVLNSMQWVASAIRSDGDIILMYNTADATDNRTEYRISTDGGVNWSTAASLDTTAGESIYNAWPVIAEADLCYIFYHVNTGPTDDAAQVYYKTLSSADALSGRTQVSTNALGGGVGERGAIIGTGYYDDAGVEVVTVVWVDSLQATPVAVARSLRDGTLQSIETVSGVAVSDGGLSGSNQFVGSVAVDAVNKVLYVLYADTSLDVWYDFETDDGGWGVDAELKDAVDCLWVKANVVTRGGNKYLAYVYDNGTGSTGGGQGPVYYSEVSLVSGEALLKIQGESTQPSEAHLKYKGLIHQESNTLQNSDAHQVLRALARLQGETGQLSETHQRLLSLARIVSETVQISETISRLLGLVRINFDTVSESEVDLFIRGLLRQLAETTQLSESVERYRGVFRVQDTNVSLTESTSVTRNLTRIQLEQESLSESELRFLSLLRTVSSSINISDTSLRFRAIVKLHGESFAISESAITVVGLLRLIAETSQLSESVIHIVTDATNAIVKVQNESVSITEVHSKFIALVRTQSEQSNQIESIIRFLNLVRTIDEIESIDDSELYTLGAPPSIVKVHTDSASLSELDFHLKGISKIESETLSISESFQRLRALARQEAEAISESEALVVSRELLRVYGESFNISETEIAARALIVFENESIEITEVSGVAAALSLTRITYRSKITDNKGSSQVSMTFKGRVK